VRRPTHQNTTWDLARDEVAAHKWVDLSQRDYGVALLNDSKYGHKVKGHIIDINLIRSVRYPGPRRVNDQDVPPGQPHPGYTDQADHVFRYGLYPHPGDPVTSGLLQAGYEFNIPLRVYETEAHPGPEPACQSYLQVDCPAVIIEAVKKAEAGEAWIVRLYEASGGAAHAQVHFSFPARRVDETDSLEEPVRQLDVNAGKVELSFRPFEIKTLRVGLPPDRPAPLFP
jgi:alpha-mannosidase